LRDFTSSCYLPKRFTHRIRNTLLCLSLGLASFSGCRRVPLPTTPAESPALRRLHANLRLIPAEARIVLGLDLDRLRMTSTWKDLAAGPLQDAALLWRGFAKGVDINPLQQVRQVLVAMPGERQTDDRLLVVLRSDALTPTRAAPWLQQHQSQGTAAHFVPPDAIVLAKGAWASQVPGLGRTAGKSPSLADDPELLRLCERAAADHVLWMAATMPSALRRELLAQDHFPDVGSLMRLRASVALDRMLSAEVVAELSNAPDARSLARRLADYLDTAKRHPDMLAQGLAPYLEGVKLAPRGPNLYATLDLPAKQAGEIVARLLDILQGTDKSTAK
jgi:hypothetical protein